MRRPLYTLKSNEASPLLKLLVLGDSAVGKSSLLTRFCDGKFLENHVCTIGIDYKEKTITVPYQSSEQKIKLQIWDTAGQERFKTIPVSYYRTAKCVIIIFDVTRYESYKSVSIWLQSLDEYADASLLRILVGNKIDLPKRAVTNRQGKQLANEYSMPYFETSARDDVGVNDLFQQAAAMVLRNLGPTGLCRPGLGGGSKSAVRIPALDDDVNDAVEIVCCGFQFRSGGRSRPLKLPREPERRNVPREPESTKPDMVSQIEAKRRVEKQALHKLKSKVIVPDEESPIFVRRKTALLRELDSSDHQQLSSSVGPSSGLGSRHDTEWGREARLSVDASQSIPPSPTTLILPATAKPAKSPTSHQRPKLSFSKPLEQDTRPPEVPRLKLR